MKSLIATLIIGASAVQLFGGASAKNSTAEGEKGVVSSNAVVPAALVGQWQIGPLTAVNFYDSNTQQWGEPNGRGIFLIIQPNGEYHFGAGEQIAATQYFIYEEGTIAIQGSQLILAPQSGSEYTRAGGIAQHAVRKSDLRPSAMQFQVVADQDDLHKAVLVLTDEHGEVITLQASMR